MGLIKKSVSDIERKLKYARIVMRVLKECHLVKEFMEYTDTNKFRRFAEKYAKSNYTCHDVWYDKEKCASILGSCNFDYYIEEKYGREISRKYHPYHLVLCYLALFDKEEYTNYAHREEGEWISSEQYIENALQGKNYYQGFKDIEIVKKWVKLKEVLYGNKD